MNSECSLHTIYNDVFVDFMFFRGRIRTLSLLLERAVAPSSFSFGLKTRREPRGELGRVGGENIVQKQGKKSQSKGMSPVLAIPLQSS